MRAVRTRKLLGWRGESSHAHHMPLMGCEDCTVSWCAPCLLFLSSFLSPSASDHLFELNYAITLFNHQELEQARAHFKEFKALWAELEEEVKTSDPDVVEQMNELEAAGL
jgi:hypothetical protein